jgi:hypothetical protein
VIQILDQSAWREFRGRPSISGVNNTTHLAKIADKSGKLHSCVVKLLPTSEPSLLAESIGWLLARSCNIKCSPFGAIVLVPVAELRKSMPIGPPYDTYPTCPAWCSAFIEGNSLKSVMTWNFVLATRTSLFAKDMRRIASFDVWSDLQDRNVGNVISCPDGSYAAIDHETILHGLLWTKLTGKSYVKNSINDFARATLSNEEYQQFLTDMVDAANAHSTGLNSAQTAISDIIHKIRPSAAKSLASDILTMLTERSKPGWLAGAAA